MGLDGFLVSSHQGKVELKQIGLVRIFAMPLEPTRPSEFSWRMEIDQGVGKVSEGKIESSALCHLSVGKCLEEG